MLCRIEPEKGIAIAVKVEPGSQQAVQAWMPVQGVMLAAGRLAQVIEQLTRGFVHPVLSLYEWRMAECLVPTDAWSKVSAVEPNISR